MASSWRALALLTLVGCSKPETRTETDPDPPARPKPVAKEEKSSKPAPLRLRQQVYLYHADKPHDWVALFENSEARRQWVAAVKEKDTLGAMEFVRAVPGGTSARVVEIGLSGVFVEIRDGFRLGERLLLGAESWAHPEQAPELTDAGSDAP